MEERSRVKVGAWWQTPGHASHQSGKAQGGEAEATVGGQGISSQGLRAWTEYDFSIYDETQPQSGFQVLGNLSSTAFPNGPPFPVFTAAAATAAKSLQSLTGDNVPEESTDRSHLQSRKPTNPLSRFYFLF
ncbi:hypothetical protein CapIbe_018744 [Capra ibex]